MFRADASLATSKEPLLFHSFVMFNQSTKLLQQYSSSTCRLSLPAKYDEISDDAKAIFLKFIYLYVLKHLFSLKFDSGYDHIDPFIAHQLLQFSFDFSFSKLYELCDREAYSVTSDNVLRLMGKLSNKNESPEYAHSFRLPID